jgi:hypothetical protein
VQGAAGQQGSASPPKAEAARRQRRRRARLLRQREGAAAAAAAGPEAHRRGERAPPVPRTAAPPLPACRAVLLTRRGRGPRSASRTFAPWLRSSTSPLAPRLSHTLPASLTLISICTAISSAHSRSARAVCLAPSCTSTSSPARASLSRSQHRRTPPLRPHRARVSLRAPAGHRLLASPLPQRGSRPAPPGALPACSACSVL